MKPEKIKVGLVGLGEQSVDNLLPSLFLSSYANLVAICDINENKLNSIGMKNGIVHAYVDYRNMIDSEGLDAVVVCSFPDVHYEVAKYALENGLALHYRFRKLIHPAISLKVTIGASSR
jgi:predicted dehydrogenase